MDHPVLAAIEAETRDALLALRAQEITDPQAIVRRACCRSCAHNDCVVISPDGYGVLAAERSCVADASLRSACRRRTLRRILLVSDGYYRLVDHYGAASDAELVRRTDELGADALLKQLRAIEAADPLAAQYPRLKIADDATALLIGVDHR